MSRQANNRQADRRIVGHRFGALRGMIKSSNDELQEILTTSSHTAELAVICWSRYEGEVMERRKHERRYTDASFFLIERRDEDSWKYRKIALCLALLVNFGWLLLR